MDTALKYLNAATGFVGATAACVAAYFAYLTAKTPLSAPIAARASMTSNIPHWTIGLFVLGIVLLLISLRIKFWRDHQFSAHPTQRHGGDVILQAGAGRSGGAGGNINFRAGDGSSGGPGGNITIKGGDAFIAQGPGNIALRDAARMAYEAVEGTLAEKFISGLNKAIEERLSYFEFEMLSADLKMYGTKPPSSIRRQIPIDILKSLQPVDGKNELAPQLGNEIDHYIDVIVDEPDLHAYLDELRARVANFKAF